ncbi:unnamed protein product [Somion occarium]|uniref:F-box domain-containing protein n=1 Tax=Somion occarium TaxID=3059160 RepID=A0ABP1D1Q6_9APHY
MVPQHNQPESRLVNLPSELVEHTLVFTASLGFPEAIAAVAQTCRDMRTLIYGASDQHLWRELYLMVFDDARLALDADRQDGGPDQIRGRDADTDFDWGAEFSRRVWAKNYIQRCTKGPCRTPLPPLGSIQNMAADLNALEALLSAVHTAAPFPSTIVVPFLLPENSSQPHADAAISSRAHPIFPPPPSAYLPESRSGGPAASGSNPDTQADGTPYTYSPSLNIRWFDEVLSNGLPLSLSARLSSVNLSGGPLAIWPAEIESSMMRALGRITAFVGFKPIPLSCSGIDQIATLPTYATDMLRLPTTRVASENVNETQSNSGNTAPSESESSTREEGVQTDAIATVPLNMSIAAQKTRARRLARMRVYNMNYLARERHWGPFLLPSSCRSIRSPAASPDLMFTTCVAHEDGHPGQGNGASNSDSDDDLAVPGPPSPSQMHADWAYLGAVRVVVEENLRATIGPDELSGLLWLEGLRRGGVPKGFDEDPLYADKGKGKQRAMHENEIEGWDWAGVDGIWRRCVCWMDYRDLIRDNLSNGFNDPTLEEATRIVPMRLRPAYYTPATIPKYAHRPTIHLDGETAGPAGTTTLRKIRGSVMMIADGNIRWTLYSSAAEDGPNEWVTEGVQVGSVMGVLGMWTGAEHAKGDPLGPFWAWKVA